MSCTDPTTVLTLPLEVTCMLKHSGSTLGFYNVTPVSKPTALTSSVGGSADLLYGAVERDLLNNAVARINELETKLQSLGLLT